MLVTYTTVKTQTELQVGRSWSKDFVKITASLFITAKVANKVKQI